MFTLVFDEYVLLHLCFLEENAVVSHSYASFTCIGSKDLRALIAESMDNNRALIYICSALCTVRVV